MAKIREMKFWNRGDVMNVCIKHDYYTRGDGTAYEKMLRFVDEHEPTKTNIFKVAKDIVEHSDLERYGSPTKEWDIQAIMFDITREAVSVHYEIIGAA